MVDDPCIAGVLVLHELPPWRVLTGVESPLASIIAAALGTHPSMPRVPVVGSSEFIPDTVDNRSPHRPCEGHGLAVRHADIAN